jgi:hypothetical protein
MRTKLAIRIRGASGGHGSCREQAAEDGNSVPMLYACAQLVRRKSSAGTTTTTAVLPQNSFLGGSDLQRPTAALPSLIPSFVERASYHLPPDSNGSVLVAVW